MMLEMQTLEADRQPLIPALRRGFRQGDVQHPDRENESQPQSPRVRNLQLPDDRYRKE